MDDYVIRVRGRVSEDALTSLYDIRVSTESVQTVLRGTLPDQAALSGLLDQLAELDLEIVEVLKVPGGPDDSTATPSD